MSETTTPPATAHDPMWDDATWHRYGFLAGIAFVVLQVISFAVTGSPPSRDATGEEITAYFVDNAGGIKLSAVLFGFSLIPAIWWLGSLWRAISRLEPSGPRLAVIAVVGLVMSGSISATVQALFVAPALRPDTLAGASEFVWSFGYAGFGIAGATSAVHMLALGVLALWRRFVPSWLGYLAFASAGTSALGIVGAGSESAAWTVFTLIGFLTWMLWILIASVFMYRSAPAN